MQLTLFTQEQPYGKTSQEPCQATKEPTSVSSSQVWLRSGRLHKSTPCWTRNTSESPNVDEEYFSSLSLILQPAKDVPTRYYLSSRAAEGIMRRADRRGKILPEILKQALIQVMGRGSDCSPSATTPAMTPPQQSKPETTNT